MAKQHATRGPRTAFGPVFRRTSLTLSKFSAKVLHAAAARADKPESTVVDLLLRKYGGTVTPEDFSTDDTPCDATA